MNLYDALSWFVGVIVQDLQYLFTWVVDTLISWVWPLIVQLWDSLNLPELPSVNWALLKEYTARANYWVPLDTAWACIQAYMNFRTILLGVKIVLYLLRG